MIRRICIRLTAFLLALLMGVFLPSCDTKPDTHNPVGEIVVVKSDFDRYVEFLKGLENECQEFSNGFTYKVMAQPVQNG